DGLPRMEAAAAKAAELDPDLADAHTALAATRFNQWDFPGAERESRAAIALNPSDPLPHAWYGYYLSSTGRNQEWLKEAQRAADLDPLSLVYGTNVVNALASAGRTDEALERLRKELELDAQRATLHESRMKIYETLHRFPEAIEEANRLGDIP